MYAESHNLPQNSNEMGIRMQKVFSCPPRLKFLFYFFLYKCIFQAFITFTMLRILKCHYGLLT
jgi:hypothetical protein